jgi:hypothetical protein
MINAKSKILLISLALFFLAATVASGQDLMDVIVSLKNIDKRINELENMQKKDIQKVQTQIATTTGSTGSTATMDTLRNQVSDLQNAVRNYSILDSSFIVLAAKFDNIEQQISSAKIIPADAHDQLPQGDLLAELKNLTGELKEVIKDRPIDNSKGTTSAPPAENKNAISNFDVKLYGFIKLEAIRDNTEVVKGDWLLYTNKNNTPQAKQRVFTMNARDSRLGMKIGGPAIGTNGKINALIEVDFTGGFPNSSTAARQPILNLRHAWLELNYPAWQARFGQDWALISGPFPNTTSFVVNAGSGNLWMRFPQVSLTYKVQPFKFAASINRPIAGNVKYEEYASGDLDPVDDGEKTGYPWLMSRIWFTHGTHTASVSGHWGQEQINDLSAKSHKMNSYSINGDLVSKIGHLNFTGKMFYGANLNTFFGGILQGYVSDSSNVKNIKAIGGWSQVMYDFSNTWSSTLGFGLDDPINSNLTTGMRSQNRIIFANVTYKIQKSVELIFETEHLRTSYLNQKAGNNLRYQFASYFRF